MTKVALGTSEAAPIEVASSDSEELSLDARFAQVTGESLEAAQQALANVDRRIREPEARLQRAVDVYYSTSRRQIPEVEQPQGVPVLGPEPATPVGRSPAMPTAAIASAEAPPTIAKSAKKSALAASAKKPQAKRQPPSKYQKKPAPKSKVQRKLRQESSSSSEAADEESSSTDESECSDDEKPQRRPVGTKGTGKTVTRTGKRVSVKRGTKARKPPSPVKRKPASKAKKPAPKAKKPTPKSKKPAPKAKKPAPKAKAQRKRGRRSSSESDSECESESIDVSESELTEEEEASRGSKGPRRGVAVKPKGKGKSDPARRRRLAAHPTEDDYAIADAQNLFTQANNPNSKATDHGKKPAPAKGSTQRKRSRRSSSKEKSSGESEDADEETSASEVDPSSDESGSEEEDEKPKRRPIGVATPTERNQSQFVILKPSGAKAKKFVEQVAPGVTVLPPTGIADSQVAKEIIEDMHSYFRALHHLDRGQHAKAEESYGDYHKLWWYKIPVTKFPCLAPIVIALRCGSNEPLSLSLCDLLCLLNRFCPQCAELPLGGCFPDGDPRPWWDLDLWFENRKEYYSHFEDNTLEAAWNRCSSEICCEGNHKIFFDMMITAAGDFDTRPFSLEAKVSVEEDVPYVSGSLAMKRSFRPSSACLEEFRFLRFQFHAALRCMNYDLTGAGDNLFLGKYDDVDRKEQCFMEALGNSGTDVSTSSLLDTAATAVPEDLSDLPTVVIPAGLSATPKPHQVQNLAWMLDREVNGAKEYVAITLQNIFSSESFREKRVVVLWNPLTMQYTSFPESTFASDPELEDWLNPTIRGGLLCDEMGLGKTLSMTMLIKAHPAPDVIPQPATEVKRDASGLTQVKLSDGTRFSFKNQDPAHPGGHATPPWATGVVQHLDTFQLEKLKATLIVVPVSLFGQWIDELRRMWGNSPLTVLPFHGEGKNKFTAADFRKADVILTTYETLRNSYPSLDQRLLKLHRRGWEYRKRVLLDKNFLKKELDDAAAAYQGLRNAPPAALRRMVTQYFETAPDSALARFQFHRVIWDECQKLTDQIPFVPADHQWLVSGTPIESRYETARLAARLGITAYCSPANRLKGNSNVNVFLNAVSASEPVTCFRDSYYISRVVSYPALSWRMMVLGLHLLGSLHDKSKRSWSQTGKRFHAVFKADDKVQCFPDTDKLERNYSGQQQEGIWRRTPEVIVNP